MTSQRLFQWSPGQGHLVATAVQARAAGGTGKAVPPAAQQGPGADRANGSLVACGRRLGRGGSGLALVPKFHQSRKEGRPG